jgi:hypothetical protein
MKAADSVKERKAEREKKKEEVCANGFPPLPCQFLHASVRALNRESLFARR